MKRSNLLRLLFCGVALLINIGCTEETPSTNYPQPNITLNVSAGEDIQAKLSPDSRFLILSGYYRAYIYPWEILKLNNVKIQWEKKSGPSSYTLENPNSIKTKVSDLEKGIYEFEITVTTDNGLIGKDTVRYTVSSISQSSKEFIFENKDWLPIWYNNIEIKNFNLLISQNSFKVYIQRENNAQWEEVKHLSENVTNNMYDYFIETRPDSGIYNYGSLYINYYGSDTNDKPSVKIVY